ncbi:hypothetical protein Ciccas_010390 [Cichlidogyrus casuarinus]|uniref:Calmodulin-binding domain-containing protein n=1 Tax=Cichlidogyrus casuarinus TaxID=1844966 RepID=A0ABD2PX65_9PLAT
MELSRSERRIQEFLLEGQLNKEIQYCAAELIRLAWKRFRDKKQDSVEHFLHNQKLIHAAKKFRKLRRKRGHLVEKSLSLVDISHENERLERLLEDTMQEMKDMREEIRTLLGGPKS